MKRDYSLFIKDILLSIESIRDFLGNMTFDEFSVDDKTASAVVHKLEIIGEAAKNVPRQIRSKYKNIPWSEMAKMRDKIAHFYFGIDYEIVWQVIKEKLPQIHPTLEKVLKDLKDN